MTSRSHPFQNGALLYIMPDNANIFLITCKKFYIFEFQIYIIWINILLQQQKTLFRFFPKSTLKGIIILLNISTTLSDI